MSGTVEPGGRVGGRSPCEHDASAGFVPSDEDAKIVTLARSARARAGAAEGAAVRDTDGRTYAAASVALPSLRITALQAAVVAAVSSGAPGLEAAAVVTATESVDADSVAAVRDLAPDALILLADTAGTIRATFPAGRP